MPFYDEGIYDSLTGLLAPAYFYESTSRLISWAERAQQPVSLISIRLDGLSDDQILRSARDLNSELRGGDLLARMGERVFVLALLGDQLGADQLIFRLQNTIHPQLNFASTQLELGEKVEVGLNRLSI